MATTRTNKVEIEITASDEATPTIDRLERKIDGLEADEARITVTAQTDRLERQLADAKTKLEGLDGDEATVQARLVGNLETSLDQAQSLLRELDGKTGTVRINAVDTASGDIDRVDQKRRDLDGKTATVKVDTVGAGDIAAGVAGGIGAAGIADAFIAGAEEANNLTLEVDELAGLTGATLEDAGRLAGIWRAQGLDVADLADVLGQVNQTLHDNPELAKQLGVDIEHNTDLIQTFVQAVDGVDRKFQDASDRQIAASQLFGEEGVRQVNKITRALDTDLATALDQFSGPIPSDESVENAREINRQITEAKTAMQELELALLPAINGLLQATISYFGAVASAGSAVAGAGGATRRFFEGLINGPNGMPGLAEEGVIARNTGGFFGGAPIGGQPYGGPGYNRPHVTIVNPPGTPPATADQLRLYDERNGNR